MEDPDLNPASIDDLRNPTHPRITNHGNQEVELKVESIEHLGSMLELDPECLEPGYKYRWVYKAPMKVSRAKAKGYAVVNPQTHRPAIVNFVGDSPGIAEDGTITVGDVVLMRTRLANWRLRRKKMKEREVLRMKGPKRSFRSKAKQASKRLGKTVRVITDEE